jgi:hypothetical protein
LNKQVHKAIDKAGYLGIGLYILGFGLAAGAYTRAR